MIKYNPSQLPNEMMYKTIIHEKFNNYLTITCFASEFDIWKFSIVNGEMTRELVDEPDKNIYYVDFDVNTKNLSIRACDVMDENNITDGIIKPNDEIQDDLLERIFTEYMDMIRENISKYALTCVIEKDHVNKFMEFLIMNETTEYGYLNDIIENCIAFADNASNCLMLEDIMMMFKFRNETELDYNGKRRFFLPVNLSDLTGDYDKFYDTLDLMLRTSANIRRIMLMFMKHADICLE